MKMEPMTWAAILVAVVGPVFTWLVARRKVAVDESAEVFNRWKDLTDRMESMAVLHSNEMRELREELRLERIENNALRQRVKELENQVESLRRQIIQNSSSGAALIAGQAKRVDQLEGEKNAEHHEFDEYLSRLDEGKVDKS